MSMTRVSTAELAEHLSDILGRVAAEREQFVVEHHGVVVAVIQPPASFTPTLHQLATLLHDVPWPDSEYFDEIAAARRDINVPLDPPTWPS